MQTYETAIRAVSTDIQKAKDKIRLLWGFGSLGDKKYYKRVLNALVESQILLSELGDELDRHQLQKGLPDFE